MDPDAAFQQLIQAIAAGDRQDVSYRLDHIRGWVDGGGALPAVRVHGTNELGGMTAAIPMRRPRERADPDADPRTRKITLTVFCLQEDAEAVKRTLYDSDTDAWAECWFHSHDAPLANPTVRICKPTPAQDRRVREALDAGGCGGRH